VRANHGGGDDSASFMEGSGTGRALKAIRFTATTEKEIRDRRR